MAAVWLSGVLLFVKTTLATAHDPIHTYDATAGVGQFNGSYVKPFFEKLQNPNPEYRYRVMPYSIHAIVYNLVVNSLYSTVSPPINCEGRNCDSYLLTGGLIMATPLPPTIYPSYPLILIHDVPASQLEFRRGLSDEDTFSEGDCTVYGSEGFLIGVRFCVANSRVAHGSLIAGIYVCTNGTRQGECLTNGVIPNITTTFSIYNRRASVITARSNFSIMSVSSIGPPTQDLNINLAAYRTALDWLLDFNATGIPAPSSIAERFWNTQDLLLNEVWSIELYQTLQSIVAFPIWQFNPNNFGNPDLAAQEIVSTLPPEFYTNASIVAPYTKIVVNRDMFIAFLVLESIVLAFIWIVLLYIWIARSHLPIISSYPLIDFVLKTRNAASSGPLSPLDTASRDILCASDKDIRSSLRDTQVFSLSKRRGLGLKTGRCGDKSVAGG
ncbi:MAG: hypothetical protein M1840_006365 [Geoglossum simile]|nr:MAG: hypothetical protein M1840_006365 [Geoglossum simile]